MKYHTIYSRLNVFSMYINSIFHTDQRFRKVLLKVVEVRSLVCESINTTTTYAVCHDVECMMEMKKPTTVVIFPSKENIYDRDGKESLDAILIPKGSRYSMDKRMLDYVNNVDTCKR